MSTFVVEHGHSLDVSWEVPGASLEGVPLNVRNSFVVLTYPDGSTRTINAVEGLTITREVQEQKIMANLNWSDTKDFPIGDTEYHLYIESTEGVPLVDETGIFSLTEPVSAPTERTVRPWDLLNPWETRASDEVKEERMTICNDCDQLHHGVCDVCHCIMKLKTGLGRATCPLGKW